jgi:polar amino acid transport system substrate-binding protein
MDNKMTPLQHIKSTQSEMPRLAARTSTMQMLGPVPILVISQSTNLEAFERILHDLHVNLVNARSLEEALEQLNTHEFAVILINAQMDGLDALKIASLIKARDESDVTPIMFITQGHYDQQTAAMAYDFGAVDFLFYPIHPRVMRAKISVFVDLFRKARQVRLQAQELIQYKADLEERLSQVSRLNLQLRRVSDKADAARELAEATAKFKSEFLANMSHEIRTPLNGILGMAEMVARTQLNDQQRKYISTIQDAGSSLLSVVNDVLDFSKIEAGKMVLETISFSPVQLVESVGDILMGQARKKQLSLVTYVDPTIPQSVHGDPARLRQILLNLTGNAIKFSDQGEVVIAAILDKVEPSGIADGITIRFSVSDTGIGMSEEQMEKLFHPFVQVDSSATRKHGGTGLGLSICKQLVNLMGGQVDVRSKQGLGSTFFFTVPFESEDELRHPCQTDLKDYRVLIVNNRPGERETLKKYLDGWGMRCRIATTAAEAWEASIASAESDPFDVIVIDWMMPEQAGFNLAQAIRNDRRTDHLALIFLTTPDAPAPTGDVFDLGVNLFLSKPIKQAQLLDGLSHALMGGCTCHPREANNSSPISSQNFQSMSLQSLTTGHILLLVEDHPMNQFVGTTMLSDLGFAVHVANNGKEALDRSLEQYSLVLMDVQMPEMNGLDATRAIRLSEQKTGRHVPVIAMTAHAVEGSREECLAAGMDDFITKPIDRQMLKDVLANWLRRAAASQATGELPPLEEVIADRMNYEPLLDFTELQERFGSKGTDKMLKIFLAEAISDFVDIKTAYLLGNAKLLQENAHRLKGVCAQLSADRLKCALLHLEEAARDNEMHLAGEILPRIETVFKQTYDLISEGSGILMNVEYET